MSDNNNNDNSLNDKYNQQFKLTTEKSSNYDNLEQMSVKQLITNINKEDQSVPIAISKSLDQIERVICEIEKHMKQGNNDAEDSDNIGSSTFNARLFYIGAGTSGRLGVVDASECPPTYGVDKSVVVGLIAGGDTALRNSVEIAEDDTLQAWKDLQKHNIKQNDVVIGIAASGRTPYVVGGLKCCRANNITTACITCNPNTPIVEQADFPIVVEVGPEFVTGSTRMKSGTAQKLVLNMISTSVMIRMGRVKGNKMVDMQLSNTKLVGRGAKMVADSVGCSLEEAKQLLATHKTVRNSIDAYNANKA